MTNQQGKLTTNNDSRSNSGSIMMFVVLFVATFFIFAALAINSSILVTTKSEQKNSASYIALGALKAFNQASGTDLQRLNAAVARAKELAGETITIADPFMENPNEVKEIGSTQTGHASANGVISPGVWYFRPGVEDSCSDYAFAQAPCPCRSDNQSAWNTPCFQEIDLATISTDDLTPNAFKVQVYTSDTSPFKTILGGVTSTTSLKLTSEATAAAVPRHAVFLVDLSRSSQEETHLPYEKGTGDTVNYPWKHAFRKSNEYSFRMSSPAMCPPTANTAPAPQCFLSNPMIPTSFQCHFDGGRLELKQESMYNFFTPPTQRFMSPIRNITQLAVNSVHYHNDFSCYEAANYSDVPRLMKPADLPPAPITERFMIDSYFGPTSLIVPPTSDLEEPYRGAEPYSSMLHAVNTAANFLEENPVPGDQIAMIGFDSSASIDLRNTGLIAVPFAGKAPLAEFTDLKEITDTENLTTAKLTKRFQDYFFFPRGDDYANIPEALDAAQQLLLNSPTVSSSKNFTVLLSDGLTNCTFERNCGPTYADFQNSLAQSLDILNNDYLTNNIGFHTVLFGKDNAPHTRLLPYTPPNSATTLCMTEEQARLQAPPSKLVDTTRYSNLTAEENYDLSLKRDSYFFGSNEFYDAVQKLDGVWSPIRSCCQSSGVCSDVSSFLNTECANSVSSPAVVAGYTDSFGRLTCDPNGRLKRTQVQDAVYNIFRQEPYILVDLEVTQ